MTNNLEIIDLQLSPPHLVSEPEKGLVERVQIVDMSIILENNSRNVTYYVISSVRSIRYDVATSTLHLSLVDPVAAKKSEPIHIILPSTLQVLAGKSAVIKVAVPLVIKNIIHSPSKLGARFQTLDISGLKHIICTLGYGKESLDTISPKSAEQIVRQLEKWTNTIRKRFDRTIPDEPEKEISNHR